MGRQEQETALFDQPEDLMSNDKVDATFHPGKKPKKARYTPTPAQVIMRDEMTSNDEPVQLSVALEEALGVRKDEDPLVVDMALAIIADHDTLSLSLRQWRVVQDMVEHGLRSGIQLGRDLGL